MRRAPEWLVVLALMLAVSALTFGAVVAAGSSGPDPTDHDAPRIWR